MEKIIPINSWNFQHYGIYVHPFYELKDVRTIQSAPAEYIYNQELNQTSKLVSKLLYRGPFSPVKRNLDYAL